MMDILIITVNVLDVMKVLSVAQVRSTTYMYAAVEINTSPMVLSTPDHVAQC